MWLVETGVLLKSFDAHFARINNIRPLINSQSNCIVTSSMDRTMKVWNLNNIFEEVLKLRIFFKRQNIWGNPATSELLDIGGRC